MDKVQNALTRLRAMSGVGFDGSLLVPPDPDRLLAGFREALQRLRANADHTSSKPPATEDVDALWEQWQRSRRLEGFTRRQLRALCWDRRAAGDSEYVRRLESDGLLPQKPNLLRGLWFAHQQFWRLPTAARIEQLVQLSAQPPQRAAPWIEALMRTPRVASSEAPAALGSLIGRDPAIVRQLFDQHRVLPKGELGTRCMRVAISEWLTRVVRTPWNEPITDVFEPGVTELMHPDVVSPDVFREGVEVLLSTTETAPGLKPATAQWIVREPRLGHPRRNANAGNWAGFSEKSRQIAVRLFASREIADFFDVLMGGSADTQNRKTFWLAYANSPQLVDYAVACDYYDRQKLVQRWGKERRGEAALTDALPEHSAFIIHFRGQIDLVAVEFSKPNNAMYLYTLEQFERHVGTLSKPRFGVHKLKNKVHSLRHMSHVVGWARGFSAELAASGIYPGTKL
jgi:hypothetical protein